MIKQVLAAVAVSLMSGAALAQTYIPMSPPPAAFVPPSVVAPHMHTTAAPSPARDQGEVTVQKVVDRRGNAPGINKDLLAGSP